MGETAIRCQGTVTVSVKAGRSPVVPLPPLCYRMTTHASGLCWQHRQQAAPTHTGGQGAASEGEG